MDLASLPIEIAPLQAHEFACPQAETRRHNTHRSNRFSQFVQQHPELLNRQDPGLSKTLRRTFYSDETHRISFDWNQFPTHRPIEEQVHHFPDVAFTFSGKLQIVDPKLDGKRLYLGDWNISPFGFYVGVDPAYISRARYLSLR